MKEAWIIPILLLAACATRHAPPSLPVRPPRPPAESWAQVLEEHVDQHGRIDFEGLAANPEPLEHFIAFVAEANPDPDDVAFHINAYNALAMYNVIRTGILPRDRLGFFILQSYSVGGRYWSLYDLENKVIRQLGEPRVHFALNCMVRSCPTLLREPYRAGQLDEQLDNATRRFLRDERSIQVDHERGVVLLSKIFDWYREDFGGRNASIIEYINRYREDPIPTDSEIRFLSWDWTLNRPDARTAGGDM